jgi:hypothetical protein
MPRFHVRTLMIAVGVVALLLGSIEPGQRWYRRWTFYRDQAAVYSRLEGTERRNYARESRASADREAIRRGLMTTQGFAVKSPEEIDRAVDRTVAFHRQQAAQSLAAARDWAEKRRDCETAAFWCWDPFAPDVP